MGRSSSCVASESPGMTCETSRNHLLTMVQRINHELNILISDVFFLNFLFFCFVWTFCGNATLTSIVNFHIFPIIDDDHFAGVFPYFQFVTSPMKYDEISAWNPTMSLNSCWTPLNPTSIPYKLPSSWWIPIQFHVNPHGISLESHHHHHHISDHIRSPRNHQRPFGINQQSYKKSPFSRGFKANDHFQ